MILTIIFGAIVLGLLYILLKPMDYWLKKGVPHEKPFPVFGNLTSAFLRRKHMTYAFQDVYEKFYNERYFGFFMGSRPVLMIKDPSLIKQIGIKDFDSFPDHTMVLSADSEPILGKVLIGLRGQEWKDMRATLSPAFTSAKMKNMLPMLQECNESFVEYLKKNCVNGQIDIELMKVFSDFMIDVIGTTNFGIQCHALEDPNNDFVKAAKAFRTTSLLQNIKMMLVMIAPKFFAKLGIKVFPTELSSYIHNILHDTIKERQKNNIVRHDLIHLLNEARNERLQHETEDTLEGFATVEESEVHKKHKKKPLDDLDMTAQAMLFFLAGFSTSSAAISFLIYELARNQDIQKKLREEVDVAKEKLENQTKEGKDFYDTLLRMKYLDQVVSETLRMWPPAFQTDRACVKDFTIEPVNPQEKALTIEAGQTVAFPTYSIHHDPKFYPNPEKFEPERFNDENKHKIVPGSYIPFGIGPRNCIGSRFGLLNIKCVVFNLVANFEIVPNDRTDLKYTLSPKTPDMSTENNCVTLKMRS